MRGRFKAGACTAAQSACWLHEGHTGNGSRGWSSAFLVKDTMRLRAVRHAIARSAQRKGCCCQKHRWESASRAGTALPFAIARAARQRAQLVEQRVRAQGKGC